MARIRVPRTTRGKFWAAFWAVFVGGLAFALRRYVYTGLQVPRKLRLRLPPVDPSAPPRPGTMSSAQLLAALGALEAASSTVHPLDEPLEMWPGSHPNCASCGGEQTRRGNILECNACKRLTAWCVTCEAVMDQGDGEYVCRGCQSTTPECKGCDQPMRDAKACFVCEGCGATAGKSKEPPDDAVPAEPAPAS